MDQCQYDTKLSNDVNVKCKNLTKFKYCGEHNKSLYSLLNKFNIIEFNTSIGKIDFLFKNLECIAYIKDLKIQPLTEIQIQFLDKKGINTNTIKTIKTEKCLD